VGGASKISGIRELSHEIQWSIQGDTVKGLKKKGEKKEDGKEVRRPRDTKK